MDFTFLAESFSFIIYIFTIFRDVVSGAVILALG